MVKEKRCAVYTAKEVQELLDIGRSSTYELLKRASKTQTPFRVIRVGKQIRVPRDAFEAWVEGGDNEL